MPWVHFEYINVASRNHTRDECTASAVGGASSGNGTANGTVTGVAVAQRHEVSRADDDVEIAAGVDVTAADGSQSGHGELG